MSYFVTKTDEETALLSLQERNLVYIINKLYTIIAFRM